MTYKLLAALPVLLAVSVLSANADDLSSVRAACGDPATVSTTQDSGMWYRTAQYNLVDNATIRVRFASERRKGPWVYNNALHFGGGAGILEKAIDVMPCLKNAGVIPEPVAAARLNPAVATSPASDLLFPSHMVVVLLLVVIGACIYFMPMAVAMHRGISGTGGVAVVNIFLGWTFIGWVVALAWAASGQKRPVAPATAN